ncbi:MAG: hypothetical protein ACK4GO_06160 [Gemmobacter sp.]
MTDTGPSDTRTLPQKVSQWIGAVYSALKWSDEPPGMSQPSQAALDLLGMIADPRTTMATAPEDATDTEVLAIDTAYDTLVFTLRAHTSSDVANVRKEFDGLLKMVSDTKGAVVKRLKDRQTALTDRLAEVPYADGAPTEDVRRLARTRTALHKDVSAAETQDSLATIDVRIDDFGKDTDAVVAVIPLRKAALDDIAAFEAEVKKLAADLDRGFFEYLGITAKAARGRITTAVDAKDLKAATDGLAAARSKVADALAYAEDYDNWARKVEVYLATMVPPTEKDRLGNLRHDLADAAAARARAGDFPAARNELAKFEADGSVGGGSGGDFDKTAKFAADVAALQNGPEIATIKIVKPTGHTTIDPEFAAARKKGLKDKDLPAAQALLDALKLKVAGSYSVCLLLQRYGALVTSATPNTDPVKQAIQRANVKCGAKDWGGALSEFSGLDASIGEKADATRRLAKLTKRVELLRGPELAAFTYVSGFLTTAQNEINAAAYDKADAAMDTADAELKSVEPWAALAADARAARVAHDNGDVYGLLGAADTLAQQHKYAAAMPELKAAIAGYQAIGAYGASRAQVDFLHATLDAASETGKAVKAALDKAHDLAVVQKKVVEARDALLDVLKQPALAEAGTEAGAWLAQLKPVEDRHNGLIGKVEPAAAKKTLQDSLEAAKTKAGVDKDIPAAVKLLEAHAALVTDARDYIALRKRLVNVKAALDRAAKTFAADPLVVAAIYDGPDDKSLVKAMADVDAQAVKGDVSKAVKECDKLLKDWSGRMRAAGKTYELADASVGNAGHSLDRHGPEVSDEKLLRRLTTGIAPDDKTSTTKKSSRFDNFESWLQAREISAQEVESMEQVPGSGVTIDLSKPEIPLDDNAVIKVDCQPIDHEGPIDKAFVGIKPEIGVDADKGRIVKGDTFETYETLTGITKSKAMWLFEIDYSDLIIPPTHTTIPHDKRNPKGYKELWTARKPTVPLPATIPGKWVMMQLFPLVDNWDQEKQAYV